MPWAGSAQLSPSCLRCRGAAASGLQAEELLAGCGYALCSRLVSHSQEQTTSADAEAGISLLLFWAEIQLKFLIWEFWPF